MSLYNLNFSLLQCILFLADWTADTNLEVNNIYWNRKTRSGQSGRVCRVERQDGQEKNASRTQFLESSS